jgi:hypothetical protein
MDARRSWWSGPVPLKSKLAAIVNDHGLRRGSVVTSPAIGDDDQEAARGFRCADDDDRPQTPGRLRG